MIREFRNRLQLLAARAGPFLAFFCVGVFFAIKYFLDLGFDGNAGEVRFVFSFIYREISIASQVGSLSHSQLAATFRALDYTLFIPIAYFSLTVLFALTDGEDKSRVMEVLSRASKARQGNYSPKFIVGFLIIFPIIGIYMFTLDIVFRLDGFFGLLFSESIIAYVALQVFLFSGLAFMLTFGLVLLIFAVKPRVSFVLKRSDVKSNKESDDGP